MNKRTIILRLELLKSIFFNDSTEFLNLFQEIKRLESTTDDFEQYNLRFSFLYNLSQKWGFEIYNRNLYWLEEQQFWKTWKESPYYKKQLPDRKFVAWTMALNAMNIKGDTAECGILDGATSYLICSAIKEKGVDKFHHAFDSWEGLSEPMNEDKSNNVKNFFTWKKGDLSVSEEETRNNLSIFDNVNYYKGWIPNRFGDVNSKSFCFVHIDVDLYQPTKDSLEFFYPRMNQGGIILCDDYGYQTCPGAKKAFDDFISNKCEQSVIHLPTGQGFIVKR